MRKSMGCFALFDLVLQSENLQSESSGREPENGKFPKVVRRGFKRSFEPRE